MTEFMDRLAYAAFNAMRATSSEAVRKADWTGARGEHFQAQALGVARAVLLAAREPSLEMHVAGSLAWPSGARYAGDDELPIWHAMIDAALSEDE